MFGISAKALLIVGAFCYLLLLGWAINRAWVQRRQTGAAEIATKPLNDSTKAKLTTSYVERDSLRVLLKAARQLNGELVAALRIAVPKRETVYVHDTIETIRYVDGSRTATFGDSTGWAVVKGVVKAPPFPAPLGVSYTVTQPPFNPAVGLVRTGNATFAVVSWQDQKFEVEVPYADLPPKLPRVIPYVRGAWSPDGLALGGAGMGFRVRKYEPFVEVQAQTTFKDLTPRLWFGTTYRW